MVIKRVNSGITYGGETNFLLSSQKRGLKKKFTKDQEIPIWQTGFDSDPTVWRANPPCSTEHNSPLFFQRMPQGLLFSFTVCKHHSYSANFGFFL